MLSTKQRIQLKFVGVLFTPTEPFQGMYNPTFEGCENEKKIHPQTSALVPCDIADLKLLSLLK